MGERGLLTQHWAYALAATLPKTEASTQRNQIHT